MPGLLGPAYPSAWGLLGAPRTPTMNQAFPLMGMAPQQVQGPAQQLMGAAQSPLAAMLLNHLLSGGGKNIYGGTPGSIFGTALAPLFGGGLNGGAGYSGLLGGTLGTGAQLGNTSLATLLGAGAIAP